MFGNLVDVSVSDISGEPDKAVEALEAAGITQDTLNQPATVTIPNVVQALWHDGSFIAVNMSLSISGDDAGTATFAQSPQTYNKNKDWSPSLPISIDSSIEFQGIGGWTYIQEYDWDSLDVFNTSSNDQNYIPGSMAWATALEKEGIQYQESTLKVTGGIFISQIPYTSGAGSGWVPLFVLPDASLNGSSSNNYKLESGGNAFGSPFIGFSADPISFIKYSAGNTNDLRLFTTHLVDGSYVDINPSTSSLRNKYLISNLEGGGVDIPSNQRPILGALAEGPQHKLGGQDYTLCLSFFNDMVNTVLAELESNDFLSDDKKKKAWQNICSFYNLLKVSYIDNSSTSLLLNFVQQNGSFYTNLLGAFRASVNDGRVTDTFISSLKEMSLN